MSSNQLNDISKVYMEAVYGGAKKENKDTRLVVTNADKKANTKAYQNYKAGNKAYKAADHLKNEEIQVEGALVKAAQGAEKVGGAIVKGGKAVVKGVRRANRAIDKADRAVTKATMNRVVKPVAKAAGKAAVGTAKAAGRAVVGGVKGAVKGALNREQLEFARHKASIISRGGRLEDAVESWNKKMAHREAMKNVEEQKEVNVKDTYKTVAAIVDYDRSKKGSKDATYDSMKGDKKAAKKERDYAAWERSKMKKDDPNWKHKKGHTGMHGEEKRWQDDDGDGKWYEKSDVDGKISKREKKAKKHNCASKVKHEEFGVGNPVKGMHDLDENGVVQHYDVFFEHGIEKNVPVTSLQILEGSMHEHVIHEADIGDILARLEKKRISKGGNPDDSPLPAMKKYHADKKKKVKKESLSDWRDDLSDLVEIVAGPEDRVEKEVKEKKVKNKVVINPKFTEAVEEMGGELLEMVEVSEQDELATKEVKDLQKAAKTGKGKYVAKADKVEEAKNCGCGQNPCVTYGTNVSEDYETKKKSEVMAALKKRTLDKKTKNKIADDIVKKKGDTSKSDDRYAYENYQAMRNPEKEEKKDTRSEREKRMADPKKGINSPAFKEFMRSRGM